MNHADGSQPGGDGEQVEDINRGRQRRLRAVSHLRFADTVEAPGHASSDGSRSGLPAPPVVARASPRSQGSLGGNLGAFPFG